MDGFAEHEGQSERDEGAVVLGRLFATERHPPEALGRSDALLDADVASVEGFREEGRAAFGVALGRDDGSDAAGSCCGAVAVPS